MLKFKINIGKYFTLRVLPCKKGDAISLNRDSISI
jgi:hypothetical protein